MQGTRNHPRSVTAGSGFHPVRRRRWPVTSVAVLLLLQCQISMAGPDGNARAPQGVEIAIAPFLPARTLVKNYQPMRAYLEKVMHEPVTFISAPDYLTYFERISRREYSFIITVAHSAWLAETESGYVPMLRPVELTHPVLVVAKNSSLKRVADLRGQTVALPDPLAVISGQAVEMLRVNGFDPGRDLKLRHFPTHSAAMNHLLAGETAAAIVSNRAMQQMSAEWRERIRILSAWEQGAAPGVIYMANPGMPRERIERLTTALLAFAGTSAEGHAFMQQTGYGGLVRASHADLAPLAPYGRWLRAEITRTTERRAPGTPPP